MTRQPFHLSSPKPTLFGRKSGWGVIAPTALASALAIAFGLFTFCLLSPLETLLWGNVGDESYLIAGMNGVRERGWFHDFYYPDLPPFYPPLYFWIFGTLAAPFVGSGIAAAKIAAAVTHAASFVAPLWFLWAWRRLSRTAVSPSERWAAVISPLLMFLFVDFDALLLKPHEVFAAILAPFWLLAAGEAVADGPLGKRRWAFLGAIGGLLFLLYHFWWIFIVPALFLAVFTARDRLNAFVRYLKIGLLVALVASPYLLPLLPFYIAGATETWQALYLTLEELQPFGVFFGGPLFFLLVGGLLGIALARRERRTLAPVALLASMLVWHLIQLVVFFAGGRPLLPGKPFLFLGTAALSYAAAFALADRLPAFRERYGRYRFVLIALAIVGAIALSPPLRFLGLARVERQLEIDRRPQGSVYIAENIRLHVPDHLERTWLTSGVADLNGYVSLGHYLAHNQHFSHPASLYSQRLAALRVLEDISDPARLSAELERLGIDSLLLYKSVDHDGAVSYPLRFQVDAGSAGNEELTLWLAESALPPAGWTVAHEDNDWLYLVGPNLVSR